MLFYCLQRHCNVTAAYSTTSPRQAAAIRLLYEQINISFNLHGNKQRNRSRGDIAMIYTRARGKSAKLGAAGHACHLLHREVFFAHTRARARTRTQTQALFVQISTLCRFHFRILANVKNEDVWGEQLRGKDIERTARALIRTSTDRIFCSKKNISYNSHHESVEKV